MRVKNLRQILLLLLDFFLKITTRFFIRKKSVLCITKLDGNSDNNDNSVLFCDFLQKKGYEIKYIHHENIPANYILRFFLIKRYEYIVSDYFFEFFFISKKQKFVCLSYFSCPFKADRRIENFTYEKYGFNYRDKLDNKIFKIRLLFYNYYYICASDFSCGIVSRSYGFEPEKTYAVGLIRQANSSNSSNSSNSDIRNILWLPTFRDYLVYKEQLGLTDNLIDPVVEILENAEEIDEELRKRKVKLTVKLHTYYPIYKKISQKLIENKSYTNIEIIDDKYMTDHNIGFNDLFNKTDALIADYSSVSFEFLEFGKPIFYFIKDFDIYNYYRGFSFESVDFFMPGEKFTDQKELIYLLDKNDSYYRDRLNVNRVVNGVKSENVLKDIFNIIR